MKIVILDGYALNPGDMSWDQMSNLGDAKIYDRTPPELVVERSEIIIPGSKGRLFFFFSILL